MRGPRSTPPPANGFPLATVYRPKLKSPKPTTISGSIGLILAGTPPAASLSRTFRSSSWKSSTALPGMFGGTP
eukprot:scaffold64146_cov35-Tisochrysis_lutea.AAC.4